MNKILIAKIGNILVLIILLLFLINTIDKYIIFKKKYNSIIIGNVINEHKTEYKGAHLYQYEVKYCNKNTNKTTTISNKKKLYELNEHVELVILNDKEIVVKEIYFEELVSGISLFIFLILLFSYGLYRAFKYPKELKFGK